MLRSCRKRIADMDRLDVGWTRSRLTPEQRTSIHGTTTVQYHRLTASRSSIVETVECRGYVSKRVRPRSYRHENHSLKALRCRGDATCFDGFGDRLCATKQ